MSAGTGEKYVKKGKIQNLAREGKHIALRFSLGPFRLGTEEKRPSTKVAY
jgi:hypothetical protein